MKKNEKGVTLVALIITIIVLLILASISIAVLTGKNGTLNKTKSAKEETRKAQYQEIIDLAKTEENTDTNRNKSKVERLKEIESILKKEQELKEAEGIEEEFQNKENPRLRVITKEKYVYYVYIDKIEYFGKLGEDIKEEDLTLDITIKQADVKFTYTPEPGKWTNKEVKVKIEIVNENYKDYNIQYSYDGKRWDNYQEELVITENNTLIYTRLLYKATPAKGYGTANVTNIDRLVPKGFEAKGTSTTSSIAVTGSTNDFEATDVDGKSEIKEYYFSKNGGATYEQNTDKLATSYTFTGLTQSTEYQIRIKAVDNAGNETETPIKRITTGIVATASGATYTPTGWTNGNVTVTLPKKDGFTTRYTTNGSAPTKTSTAYSSPFTVSGNCKIIYIYTDGTNIGGAGTANVTNIDKLAPNAFTPTATSTTKSIKVTASATDQNATTTNGKSNIAGYRFRLDSGTWTNYQASGSYTWDNLAQTTNHTITVEAKDNAGNTKTGTATKGTGTVATASGATYTPTGWTNGNVTVTLPKKDGFTTRYTTNGSAPTKTSTAYSSPFAVSGNCKITYIYTDGTNIGGAGTANVTNIDKLAPNAFTPTATSTTKSIKVTASATDQNATTTNGKSNIAGYRFRLDSGTWTNYQASGSYTWDNLAQTTNHTITVETKDNAGNTKTGTATKGTGTIATASGATYTPTGWTNGNVTVTLPKKDGFTTRYTTNGSAPTKTSTAYSSPFAVSSNCKVTYIYTDGTNIGGAGTANITNIDKTKPTMGTVTGSTETANSGTITVNSIADAGSGISGVYISTSSATPTVNASEWITIPMPQNMLIKYGIMLDGGRLTKKVTANGTYYIWLKDKVGNISAVKSCTVSGIVPKVTGVTITCSNIWKNDVTNISKSLSGGSSYKSIEFSSSNTTIATVDSSTGSVKGKNRGSCTISCTVTNYDDSKVTGSCNVTVLWYTIAVSNNYYDWTSVSHLSGWNSGDYNGHVRIVFDDFVRIGAVKLTSKYPYTDFQNANRYYTWFISSDYYDTTANDFHITGLSGNYFVYPNNCLTIGGACSGVKRISLQFYYEYGWIYTGDLRWEFKGSQCGNHQHIGGPSFSASQ